ncbi:MAG: ABC transporter permease [Pseudomonadota bacterium]
MRERTSFIDHMSYLWDLTLVLARKEMKIRYKSSVLGYLWSVLNPLLCAMVFYIAFRVVMRVQMENYHVFLICGLFPWQWFSNSLNAAPMMFLGNASIVKKTNFPKAVIVLAIVVQDMIHFLLSLPVIVVFLLSIGKFPDPSWIYGVPALMTVQLVFTFGASLFVASVNLFFRDLERLTNTAIMLLFYFTPILFPADMVPAHYRSLLLLNPLAALFTGWRTLLLEGTFKVDQFLAAGLCAALVLVMGYAAYWKLRWRFAEVL